MCTAPKDKKCESIHPKAEKGPTDAGKEAMKRFKTMDCNHHLRGTCHRGSICLLSHDPKNQGSDPKAGKGKGEGKGKNSQRNLGVEEEGATVATRATTAVVEDEAPPFVPLRPTSINTNQRRVHPNDPVYDFNSFKHNLPKTKPPEPGYCHSSMLSIDECPNVFIRVIWDGGAEGTSISDKALSRIMRAQKNDCIPHDMSFT